MSLFTFQQLVEIYSLIAMIRFSYSYFLALPKKYQKTLGKSNCSAAFSRPPPPFETTVLLYQLTSDFQNDTVVIPSLYF